MSGNITLPQVETEGKTPLPEKKQKGLLKRLEARVALVDTQMADNGDLQGYCPIHEDVVTSKKPSARFNPVYGYWYCFAPQTDKGCAESGSGANLDKLLRGLADGGGEKATVRDITSARSSRKNKPPTISQPKAVEYSTLLQTMPSVMSAIETRRLWDADTIASMTIGIVDGNYASQFNNKPRVTIPVHNSKGKYVGCRIYDALGNLAGNGDHKFSWSGVDEPADAVVRPPGRKKLAERVVIMEGEPDTILANQDFRGVKDISFVSGTKGAKRPWPQQANSMLAGRDVYICMDNDEAGKAAVGRALKAITMDSKVRAVYRLDLPEAAKDWTDFRKNTVKSAGEARKTLLRLIEDAEMLYSREQAEADQQAMETPPDETDLPFIRIDDAESLRPDAVGALADVNVLGRADQSYLLPTELLLECARDKGARCDSCPLGEAWEGESYGRAELKYYTHTSSITEMIAASDEQNRKKWKRDSGAKCADIESQTVDETFAYPYLVEDHKSKEGDAKEPLQSVMFFIGTGDIPAASVQRVRYQKVRYWKDGSTVFYTWRTDDQGNDLDNFEMPQDTHERLRKMMKGKVRDKLEEIAADYAWNVTSVFGGPRNLLHILVDLVYHSVLRLPFEGQTDMKGWLDLMVMGDSHTGKSETTRKMAAFYDMGETVNGGSATRAGVLGGMSTAMTSSKFMFPKKGALPRNHRGMLTIEESHKLASRKNADIIPQMADARDYGQFNLVMTTTMSFVAASRLLWISNPPEGKGRNTLSELSYGAAEAISEMMGGRENVTRLTMAIGVGEGEVPLGDAQPLPKYSAKPRFSSKQKTMRNLVLWAWSRTSDQVEWDEGAEELVRSTAAKMSEGYSGDFPIAKPQDLYAKLARVAAAVAARVYSSPDGERLVIQRKHVQAAARLMKEVYELESLGFAKMSRMGIQAEQRQTSSREDLKMQLIHSSAFGLCSVIVDTGVFEPAAIGHATGMLQGQVQELMDSLNRGSFLKQDGRRVRATRQLIEVAGEALEVMHSGKKTAKAPSARAPKDKKQGTPGQITVTGS